MKKILLFLLLFNITLMTNADDPFEQTNRAIYKFNQSLDEGIFEPIAKSYKKNTSQSIQNRVSDFSSNIGDISTFGNELMQFKLMDSVNTLGRVLINSTLGILGLFDIASEIELKKTTSNFGQTLAVWGVPQGPFVVLPILGPSTARGATGKLIDSTINAKETKSLTKTSKLAIIAIQALDTRVKLLNITELLKKATDPYILMRSTYLQKLKFDINNGFSNDDEF